VVADESGGAGDEDLHRAGDRLRRVKRQPGFGRVRAAAAGFWESFRKGRLIARSAGVYCEAILFSQPFTV
jgi:hypothetical protein